ncbi:uncharacterized protein [Phyllobates terribilis]|uniref:uncharacterized protein isoform X2 n=1 Tax=Phyllobates terribilis TaxID=111132 RepID=UPI003CCB1EBA
MLELRLQNRKENVTSTDLHCPFKGIEESKLSVNRKIVREYLANINEFKSPGPDELHPRVLKEIVEEILEPLSIIFENSWRTGEVPEDWRRANVVPIFKKGKKVDPGNYRPEMKNYKKDGRKLKTPQLAQPLLLLNSSSVLKPLAGDVPMKDYKNVERGLVKCNFRYPHKVQQDATTEHIIQEQPIVRKIIVDLRPVLREAVDLCEEDVSDTENNSISTAAHSDQELNRTSCSRSTLERLSEQDLQSENSSISTSGLLDRGLSKRHACLEGDSISFSLPSLRKCESCEEKLKPAQNDHRRFNLVEITNRGTLTFDKEQQFSVAPPVSFPEIILKELPSQKMSKEQRPSANENTLWMGLEKLQLPISELVRVTKEQTNSDHHTLIAKVLCSLREKHYPTGLFGLTGYGR